MNIVTWTDFEKLVSRSSTEKISALFPILITANGSPFAILEKPERVLALSDLHPRMQHILRAREAIARAGKPSPVRLLMDEVIPKKVGDAPKV
jgi:hypothetical protein